MIEGAKQSAVVDQFTLWLASLREQGRSPRTVLTYATTVKNFTRYLRRRRLSLLTAINRRHLEAWRRHLVDSGCKPATVDLFVRALRSAFTWFVESGHLFVNPADGLVIPKVPRSMNFIPSEADMRRVLESITVSDPVALRDKAILETAYATGARLEELVRLDLGSIDVANRLLRLRGKGDRDRLVPLTAIALTTLDDYLTRARPKLPQRPDEPALFCSSRGGRRLASYAIEVIVRRRAARVGLVLTPHAIRRAFATHLLRAGACPADIRELLGHRTYRHLGHYLQFHPDEMKATLQRARPCRR